MLRYAIRPVRKESDARDQIRMVGIEMAGIEMTGIVRTRTRVAGQTDAFRTPRMAYTNIATVTTITAISMVPTITISTAIMGLCADKDTRVASSNVSTTAVTAGSPWIRSLRLRDPARRRGNRGDPRSLRSRGLDPRSRSSLLGRSRTVTNGSGILISTILTAVTTGCFFMSLARRIDF